MIAQVGTYHFQKSIFYTIQNQIAVLNKVIVSDPMSTTMSETMPRKSYPVFIVSLHF